jgi:hypothetical protein
VTLNQEAITHIRMEMSMILQRVWVLRHAVRIIGFISSWLHTLSVTFKYSAIADLHTFQFTLAHALGFSLFH